MKHITVVIALLVAITGLRAQGPPITSDKPIMLGAKSVSAETLIEIRNTERGTAVYAPLMMHYLPTSNTLVGLHLPYIQYDLKDGLSGSGLADIGILGKYQFFRKDGMGKTFRMVAKTLQTLPTGEDLDLMDLSVGEYAGYYGLVSGYESLQYGISTEIGYNWMPGGTMDEFRTKLGFGLPLLKPQYPNKQINLYFEYSSAWLTERNWYQLLYAQGIQYAGKNMTVDLAVQLPLVQDIAEGRAFRYSLFIGGRYSF